VKAAEKTFTALLMSDWRLKIAGCVNPACSMYYRLGKCCHRYEHGTRCPGCRETESLGANQKRVEANRRKGKEVLYAFVARRFARSITPFPLHPDPSRHRPDSRDVNGLQLFKVDDWTCSTDISSVPAPIVMRYCSPRRGWNTNAGRKHTMQVPEEWRTLG
jgi:hypothetical protein